MRHRDNDLTCPACIVWKNGLEALADDGLDVTAELCGIHLSMKSRGVKLSVKGLIANTRREVALDAYSLMQARVRLRKRLKMPPEKPRTNLNGFANGKKD